MKNILSVDYDFFSREDPEFDWGHSEESRIFKTVAWTARYSTIDLYEECHFKHADFNPKDLGENLKKKGFVFNLGIPIAIADSHKEIYEFAKKQGKCNIYNLDAHHDMFTGRRKLDCANWLIKLRQAKMVGKAVWVKPCWLKQFAPRKSHLPKLTEVFWEDLETKNTKIKIDAVFFCRSGTWVPPHHDIDFLRMISSILKDSHGKTECYEDVGMRRFPTEEQAKKSLEQMQETLKEFRKGMVKK